MSFKISRSNSYVDRNELIETINENIHRLELNASEGVVGPQGPQGVKGDVGPQGPQGEIDQARLDQLDNEIQLLNTDVGDITTDVQLLNSRVNQNLSSTNLDGPSFFRMTLNGPGILYSYSDMTTDTWQITKMVHQSSYNGNTTIQLPSISELEGVSKHHRIYFKPTSNERTITLQSSNNMKIVNPVTKALQSSYVRNISSNTPFLYDVLLINTEVAVIKEY